MIKVASHKEEDVYHFDPETTIGIFFGELTAPYDSDRIKAIEELFKDTGIHFRATEYAREEMWSKFRLNVCNNLPQAILGAGWYIFPLIVHPFCFSLSARSPSAITPSSISFLLDNPQIT